MVSKIFMDIFFCYPLKKGRSVSFRKGNQFYFLILKRKLQMESVHGGYAEFALTWAKKNPNKLV